MFTIAQLINYTLTFELKGHFKVTKVKVDKIDMGHESAIQQQLASCFSLPKCNNFMAISPTKLKTDQVNRDSIGRCHDNDTCYHDISQ